MISSFTKFLIIIVLSALVSKVYGFSVIIHIQEFQGDRIWLYSDFGDQMSPVDSVSVLNGEARYYPRKNLPVGIYHFFLKDPGRSTIYDREIPGFSLVFDHENIEIETNYSNPESGLIVKESESNKAYYRFLKMDLMYRTKINHLGDLLLLYGKESDFFNQLSTEMVRVQTDYNDSLLLLEGIRPGSFISAYLAFMHEPVYNPSSGMDMNEYMRKNFLDPVDFNDTLLLNSPVISRKILEYMSFYRDYRLDSSEQEDLYVEAIDRIMTEASYDQRIYDFVLNYLIDGFERFQMEKVLVHLADNYLSGECETDDRKIMQERLERYQKMAVGQQVSDINLLDINGKPIRLSSADSEYILLVFWASWCTHCQNFLPRLNNWNLNENKDQVLSLYYVSIDTSRADWEEFVLLNKMEGKQLIDTGGWEGKVSRQYNLFATPTIFILNRKLEIISKPSSVREIAKEAERLRTNKDLI